MARTPDEIPKQALQVRITCTTMEAVKQIVANPRTGEVRYGVLGELVESLLIRYIHEAAQVRLTLSNELKKFEETQS